MVFQGRNKQFRDSRRFSISEWDDVDASPTTRCGSSSSGDDGDAPPTPGPATARSSPPQIDLGPVYASVQRRKRHATSDRSDDSAEVEAQVGGGHHCLTLRQQRRLPGASESRNSLGRRLSFSHNHLKRRATTEDDLTVAASSSASHVSYSSSAGTNIWTRLLARNGTEGLWDSLNAKGNVFDDSDDDGFQDDNGSLAEESWATSLKRACLALSYEARHFCCTIRDHPRILIISLATFGILCGVGLAAVNAEKGKYAKKQQMTADFIARETGEWFANEFRKAMIPLYAVQQAVIHSGYFDDAAAAIGRYPNLLISDTANATKVLRNVTGICNDPVLQQQWRDIVRPVNEDNDLNGAVFAYRLAPANVFCLWEHDGEPDMTDKNFGFDAGSSPKNSFWKTVTEDMFLHRKYSIFGPFGQPDKEWVCGHIPVWMKGHPKEPEPGYEGAALLFDKETASATTANSLNVQGNEIEGAWGFVMNYLDWRLLKDRSNIYERFAGCKLDFELTHKPKQLSAKVVLPNLLANSPYHHLLDDTNSVIIQTNSFHGIWENRVGSINGWSPPWYPATVAAVVISSLLLAFLMASALVERQLHRNLVSKMLPRRAIVKLHRGQTVLEKYNLVTIFFSDIVGFTSMAGSMRPIQVMKMLNELYTELDNFVEKHHVYKVETIGDAYMVVGGAPDRVPAPIAAERVALFALDALDFVRNFRTEDGDQIFIRAGLASGPAAAGVVGRAMPRYCFFGDTVNFASRMESTSKKMRIQCAEITFRLLRDAPNMNFTLTKRMDGDVAGIQVKGKGHQITYWIEKSISRDKSHKVIDIYRKAEPGLLPMVSEVEEVPELAAEEGNGVEVTNKSDADYEEFLQVVKSPVQLNEANNEPDPNNIDMYAADEIHEAMAAQDWSKLGYATSALVAATDDQEVIIVQASALLEHHLCRVLKERDAVLPLAAKVQCRKFVSDVASQYKRAEFHSLSHAMHVTTSMNRLLANILDEDPLNSFSLVFAALLHDAGHTGMSNKILTETKHPLSEKYKQGVPIAEKNSIDIALELLFRPEYEAFRLAILPDDMSKIEFAKTLFQGILVTDIATPEHNKLSIERYEVSQDERVVYDCRLCPLAHHISDVFDGVGLEDSVKEEYPDEFVITHRGLQKCVRNEQLMLLSDVSHLVQGWENFVKWNFRLYKELHTCTKKGLCDDPQNNWFQGQIGFIDHYMLPLTRRSRVYFNMEFADSLVANGLANRELWVKHGVKATDIMVHAAESGEEESIVLMLLYELPSLGSSEN